jgi:uncharacterized damage-inducible protein DinB
MVHHEPSKAIADPKALLLGYLDYYRAALLAKLDGLSEEDLRASRLPSGWSPLELFNHLIHMERRWLEWGFAGRQVAGPWADHVDDDPEADRWVLPAAASLEGLTARLAETARTTAEVTAEAALTDPARLGGRWDHDPPALSWILVHVLQEYARHVGHLDVVRELIDGTVGE